MKFKQFITEAGPGFNRQSLSINEAANFLSSSEYSGALQNYKANPSNYLYRGTKESYGDAALIDTSGTVRKSQNTNNAYTLCFDANSSNSEFPKRSKSMICSTSFSKASSYGHPYYLFPRNDAKIGVLDHRDIFFSKNKFFTRQISNINFNDYVVCPLFYAYMLSKGSRSFISTLLDKIVSADELIEKCFIGLQYLRESKENAAVVDYNQGLTVSTYSLMDDAQIKSSDDLKKVFFDFFDFSAQGAIALKGEDVRKFENDRECWISGNILVVNTINVAELNKKLGIEINL